MVDEFPMTVTGKVRKVDMRVGSRSGCSASEAVGPATGVKRDSLSYDSTMADSTAVDAAATTSAEAAQYQAAGWWSDATLSDRVTGHAAATPDRPAYVDFRTAAPTPS